MVGVVYGVEIEGGGLWWGWCLFVKVKEEAEVWGGDESAAVEEEVEENMWW